MRAAAVIAAFVLFGADWTPAWAVPVVPVSYSMPNGSSGTFHYWDESYTGTGCKTCDGAILSNGLGDLTNGVLASGSWFSVEGASGGPYVGWLDLNPTISFSFGQPVLIDSVTFHFDDSDAGGVDAPSSVIINSINYPVIDPAGSAPFLFTVNGVNFSGTTLPITINRTGRFTFVSEISFGSPVPDIAAWKGLAMGIAALGLAGWHRRRGVEKQSKACKT